MRAEKVTTSTKPIVKHPANSAVEQTLSAIQELIRANRLRLGDPLPTETSLAKQFGTSRNTVREAIRTLKAYGVIETRQKIGAVLTDNRHAAVMKLYAFSLEISAESFTDIQGFRRLIEEGIADTVIANATANDISLLFEFTDQMEAAKDLLDASQFDFSFHRHLVSLAGNATTSDVYDIMRPVIVQLLENGKSERSDRRQIADEHRSIVDAIKSRDRNAYVYWIRLHLQSGLKFIHK